MAVHLAPQNSLQPLPTSPSFNQLFENAVKAWSCEFLARKRCKICRSFGQKVKGRMVTPFCCFREVDWSKPSICSEAEASGGAQWQSAGGILTSQQATKLEGTKAEEDSPNLNGIANVTVTHGNLKTLPKPLSITDFSVEPMHGSNLRVAYQGLPGAYSEAAAQKAYPNCEAVPCEQFEAAFQAVELWLVDRAVLPVENSLGGSIHRNFDLLLRHRLHIVGEIQIAVHHCLLGLPGVKKEELKRVMSHPQALAQCEQALSKLKVAREAVDGTAGAAQFIAAHNLRNTGAVASSRAAEIYGLQILADGIQDDLDNVTRFMMLAREPIIPRNDRPFKTSIVFTLEEGPGVLFKALAVFSLRSINLTRIESRPQRKRPLRVVDDANNGTAKYFDYLFYIDFEASMADHRAQNALGHLQEFATFVRVLGSYPRDMAPVISSPRVQSKNVFP